MQQQFPAQHLWWKSIGQFTIPVKEQRSCYLLLVPWWVLPAVELVHLELRHRAGAVAGYRASRPHISTHRAEERKALRWYNAFVAFPPFAASGSAELAVDYELLCEGSG